MNGYALLVTVGIEHPDGHRSHGEQPINRSTIERAIEAARDATEQLIREQLDERWHPPTTELPY